MSAELTDMTVWQLPLELSARLRDYAVEVAKLNGAPPDVADDVAHMTLISLNDAVSRNPAVMDLLSGPKWRGYVATSTRNTFAGYRRSEARRSRREDEEARRSAPLADSDDAITELHSLLYLDELAVHLNHEEQVFIHLRYFDGLQMKEIAKILETTQARTSHIGRSAIRKIERLIVET